jgi:predicted amidophosphoribosyltransferase
MGEVDYAPDGQQYCSACIFYGMNRQCYRCRMYLPVTELQQYRGQWTCPYCIQDLRDEDRRMEQPAAKEDKHTIDVLTYSERCERCGRDLEGRVYIWNGKRLCRKCLGDEQDSWELVSGKPLGPAERIRVDVTKEARKTSLMEAITSEILVALRLKRRKIQEIIVYPNSMKSEIRAAKPMAEKDIKEKREASPIEVEGLMERKAAVIATPIRQDARADTQADAKKTAAIVPSRTAGTPKRGKKKR